MKILKNNTSPASIISITNKCCVLKIILHRPRQAHVWPDFQPYNKLRRSYQTHSKLVSLGNIKAMRESGGVGAIESMEQVSFECGSMKRSLAHKDFTAGIFITPEHSLCFRYEMKS